jgi:hypothetical protein
VLPGSAEVQRLMHGPANGPLLGRQLVANALVDGLEPCSSTRNRNSGLNPPSTPPFSRPELRQDYPLNLSISISGGKETNKDSPSNGERTGNSPT